MVNLLLNKGASVCAKDKKDRQAIHWAAYQGSEMIMEFRRVIVQVGFTEIQNNNNNEKKDPLYGNDVSFTGFCDKH